LKLHEWQTECLNSWAKNNYRGIVNAVTGSGKTTLALAAIQCLHEIVDHELRIKIVVPQTFLASQWKEEIKQQLGAARADIGVYHGKHKDIGKKYMIYVVNSARHSLAKHVLSDLNNGCAVLLIADECHHYGSMENNRIFDFYKVADQNAPYYTLGLSATPEIANFIAITTPLGQEVHHYDFGRALRDRVINRFILYSISLDLTATERVNYIELSERLSHCLASLMKMHPELKRMAPSQFFAYLSKLSRQEGEAASIAHAATQLMFKRKALCHMATERLPCTLSIVNALPTQSRIILFCERIKSAEALYHSLAEQYPKQAGLYHSKMTDDIRQDVLERYKRGALRLLVCCKALDEGLNIPSTDAGIIVSTTSSARQRVQRLGRMLRLSKKAKQIYYLYVGESSEEREFVTGLNTSADNIPLIALRYLERVFIHPEYEKLRKNVLEYVFRRRSDHALLSALNQNLSRALLRGDFLLSESQCRENLQNTHSISGRNYWTSVLYVILSRLGKL